MSLLLDALKRAEEAKKAQREAEAQAASDGSEPLSLAPLDETPQEQQAAEPPLTTRHDLPNISQALEILPEDLAPSARSKATQRPEPKRAQPRRAEDEDAFRNAARQLFEAKTPEYNPRKPFYITLGALSVFAIGIVVYFWYQLQPPSAPVRTAASSRTSVVAEAPREIAKPARSQTPNAATDIEAHEIRLPVEAQSVLSDAGPEFDVPASRVFQPAQASVATDRSAANLEAPVLRRVAVKKSAPSGPTAVERGYAAYEQGDLIAARTHYETALERDPLSRDALLGLAALDTREQQYLSAETHYRRLLEMDPRDPYAHAGLLSLRGQRDPIAAESRIKNLLAQRPDANVLHFTLGNQYATQGRWPEAQQAYFKAYTSDPTNPDYAFNLAVSLDHLRQPRLALEYYQKALKLAAERPAAFQAAQAEIRIVELSH